MDGSTEGTPVLPRMGHWPLLWLALPLIFGYTLGAALPVGFSPLWLIAPGLLCLGWAQWLVREGTWRLGLWGVLYFCGVLLLAWAYWLIREPKPPEGYQLPPREVNLDLRVARLFAEARGRGQLSGLGRIETPPKLLPHLAGQRVFFVVWPEGFKQHAAAGALLEVRGRLAVLEHSDDPYSFNAFLFRSGVYYDLKQGSVLGIKDPAPEYEQWAGRTNRSIRDSLVLGVGTERQERLAAISQAMLLGRKETLGRDQKERFIDSGTMHLFAVSGLHIGIVATALFFIFESLRLPRPVAAVLGLSLVAAYVLVVGHPPSAIRAYLMVFIFWSALALQKKPSPMSALLLSALAVLLWNPQELLRPGFQLSYSVVGGILLYGLPLSQYWAERFRLYRFLPEDSWTFWQRARARVWRWFLISAGVSLSATLFSTPLSLAMFGVFTPGAILLNTFLLPLASAALVAAGVSAVFGLAGLSLVVAGVNHLCWALNWLLEKIVGLGLQVPGMFHAAEWRSLSLAPITLCLMFLGYLTVLHLPRQRSWQFWVPPLILVVMLVPGLRLL